MYVKSKINLIPPDRIEELKKMLDEGTLSLRQAETWIYKEFKLTIGYKTIERWKNGKINYKYGYYEEPKPIDKVKGTKANKTSKEIIKKALNTSKVTEFNIKRKIAGEEVKKVSKSKSKKVITSDKVNILAPGKTKEEYRENVTFKANEGPQTSFLASPETDVLYGGAAGGGKSLALIVDPLRSANNPKHRALILRRSLKELRQLIDMSRDLYPKAYPGVRYKETEKMWVFPSGSRIEFGYLEKDADVYQYQGQDFCVEENTELSTPSGPIKIQDISVGTLINTLEGTRVVTNKFLIYETDCVRIEFEDGSSHIQPITHSFLTSLGWQSYASLLDIGSKESEEKSEESLQHPFVYCSVERLVQRGQEDEHSHNSNEYLVPYKLNKACFLNTSEISQQLLKKFLDQQQILLNAEQALHRIFLHQPDDAEIYEKTYLKLIQDYQDCYFVYCDLYDALLQSYLEIFQDKFPRKDDVEEPYPSYHSLDAQDNILEDSHSWLKQCVYYHPYTGQARIALYQRTFDSCKISYVGKKYVCDITVDQANHYIIHDTSTIVKNSYIAFDEISQLPTEFPWHYLASRLRTSDPNLKVYLRCTTNPGGPGHHWVKKRYVEPNEPGVPFMGPDGISRRFIPARLRDNPYLFVDGRYQKMLESLPEVQRRQLLDGDWDVAEGMAFPEFQKPVHVVQPFDIPRGWARFKSCDYGFSAPSCVLWAAADPTDGTIIVYKELYQKNLTGKELGDKIIELEMEEFRDIPGVIDHSVFNRTGYAGPTIGETLNRPPYNLKFRPADKNRKAGKIQVHEYLRLNKDTDRPRLQIFSTCTNLIRELSALTLAKNDPEDVDTDHDDHAYDAVRYLLMSRPKALTMQDKFLQMKKEVYVMRDPVYGY